MEAFNFELKLISDVDKVANRGTEALKKTESQGKKTEHALDFSKALGAVDKQLERLNKDPAGFVKMKKAQRELAEQQKKLLEGAGLAKSEGFMKAVGSKLGFSKLVGAAAIGDIIGEGIIGAGEMLVEAAHKFVEVISEGVSKAFEEAGKQQTLQLGERLSLGGPGAKEYQEDTGRFSKLTGFDDDTIRKMLLPARRAGMDQKGVRTAFAAAADVAAGEGQGGNEGRIGELVAAFTKIKLKGGVQERFLPELGVNVKEFYGSLAKQLHISAEAAKKKAEEGKLDPQLLLNTVYKSIEAKQGGALGTGAIEYSKTFDAHLAKIKNLPNEYLKGLVNSPAFARASDMLGSLLDKLDPESPTGKRIEASVESLFDKIVGWVGQPEDAIDDVVAGIQQMIAFVDELIPDLREMFNILVAGARLTKDLAYGARLTWAAAHGDVEGGAKIMYEHQQEQKADNDARLDGIRKKTERVQDQAPLYKAAGSIAGGGGIFDAFAGVVTSPEARKNAGKNGTTIVHAPVTVEMHGNHDDPQKAGEVAGEAAVRHISRHIARQSKQAGG